MTLDDREERLVKGEGGRLEDGAKKKGMGE